MPTAIPTPPIPAATPAAPPRAGDDAARREAIRATAVEFEAVFLTQMLQHAGVGDTPSVMGGGAGEDGFKGLLLAEQGQMMAEAGGIGLADHIYRSMLRIEGMDGDGAP